MKIQIHTEGFGLTEALREYTDTCAKEALESFPEDIKIDTFSRREGYGYFSHILKASLWKKTYVLKKFGPDLYTLISQAFKDMNRNLNKMKGKRKALRHRHA